MSIVPPIHLVNMEHRCLKTPRETIHTTTIAEDQLGARLHPLRNISTIDSIQYGSLAEGVSIKFSNVNECSLPRLQ
jgi:hypothetical protein